MHFRPLIPAMLAVAVVFSGASPAAADESPALPLVVEHYLPVREALAADNLDGVAEHARALSESKDRALAAAAGKLGDAQDIGAARKAFGEVSRVLIKQLKASSKKKVGSGADALLVFECPMAKPYGKWLQAENAISNPYMGAKMPRCGKLVDMAGGREPARLLREYFTLRTALAGDTLEGVRAAAGVLAVSKDKAIASAARELASAKGIAAARKAFGGVSAALIKQVEANAKKKKGAVQLPTVYLFKCPMAKPYGKWLQETDGISNPYMGARMPRCGKLLSTLGGSSDGAATYGCPMHPDVAAKAPGKCPKCGMALRKKE